jgi:hypothetical protein
MKINDKDKQEIIEAVADKFKKMLTTTITWEKIKGDGMTMNSAPIVKHEDVFLPSIFMQLLSSYEGSNRGLQEEISYLREANHDLKAEINCLTNKVEAVGQAMIAMEKPLLQLVEQKKIVDTTTEEKLRAVIENKSSSAGEKSNAKELFKKLTGKDYESLS